jgi:mannose-6-phosphate isomerase-like protein (cupin superfamily)
MVQIIHAPANVPAAGAPAKQISEYFGRVSTRTDSVSIALMTSPTGWQEPGQIPEFDEYTVVLDGALSVETQGEIFSVSAGQAVLVHARDWVRYSTPSSGGARYLSVCLPAFSPETVHRDPD